MATAGEIEIQAQYLAEKIIETERRILFPKEFPDDMQIRRTGGHKDYVSVLHHLVVASYADPLYQKQVLFESKQSPQPKTLSAFQERMVWLYGINTEQRQFGIYHPDTAKEAQKNSFQTMITTAANRLRLHAANPLTLTELVTLGLKLGLDKEIIPELPRSPRIYLGVSSH